MTAKAKRSGARHLTDASDLLVELRRVAPYTDRIIAHGIHPRAVDPETDEDVEEYAQILAGYELSFRDDAEDQQKFADILGVIDQAYLLGLAVGLRLSRFPAPLFAEGRAK